VFCLSLCNDAHVCKQGRWRQFHECFALRRMLGMLNPFVEGVAWLHSQRVFNPQEKLEGAHGDFGIFALQEFIRYT
jgi:hypothetical protein